MTGLIPFNRRRNELDNLGTGNFYNMLDDFFNDSWFSGRNLAGDTFKMDVKEKDSTYIIEAELPGVSKENIDLDLTDERLTISVKHEEDTKEEKDNYVHRERRLCSMSRSIHLNDADFGSIKAKLDNGILTISIPRKEPVSASTKINID